MPFCSKCGTLIEPDMKYCPNCGNPLVGKSYPSNVPYGDETMDEEQYLGGLSSIDIAKKGGLYGYGIYATNRRIIGIKSWRETFKGITAFVGILPYISAVLISKKLERDENREILKKLEEKKDFEIFKEQISRLEIQMPKKKWFSSGEGNLFITSKTGETTMFYLRDKHMTKKIRTLMQAFFPEVVTIR